ncbi:hypothetical protein C0995_013929 [Termitomyces sp. Mi166|nr:hypothetical protein C0995_013929 [Termitomyces sp. Mi166\
MFIRLWAIAVSDTEVQSYLLKDFPETSATLTAARIAEMRLVDNPSNLTIIPVRKIISAWSGHILDKDDAKYANWAYAMKLELPMVQLWDYIFNLPSAPHATYKPHAHHAWASKKRLTCLFIKRAISMSEQKLCVDEEDPIVL